MHGCGALRLGQPRVTGEVHFPVGGVLVARHPRSADMGLTMPGLRSCSI